VLAINLTGAFYGVKHAARAMKKAGRSRRRRSAWWAIRRHSSARR
jgi:NAD(P)-dependent dehydrogenase (short-subunit alcohol dehydrogenase family)